MIFKAIKIIKHVCCNPDVAPRLTSGGYVWSLSDEDKVDAITQINILFIRGWQILIPDEDKVDVITPTNILFIGGDHDAMMWWCDDVMMIDDDDDDDDDDGDDDDHD